MILVPVTTVIAEQLTKVPIPVSVRITVPANVIATTAPVMKLSADAVPKNVAKLL